MELQGFVCFAQLLLALRTKSFGFLGSCHVKLAGGKVRIRMVAVECQFFTNSPMSLEKRYFTITAEKSAIFHVYALNSHTSQRIYFNTLVQSHKYSPKGTEKW